MTFRDKFFKENNIDYLVKDDIKQMIESSMKQNHIDYGTHLQNKNNLNIETSIRDFKMFIYLIRTDKFDKIFVGDSVPYTNTRDGYTKYFGNFESVSFAFFFELKTNSNLDILLKNEIKNSLVNLCNITIKESYIKRMKQFIQKKYKPTKETINMLLKEVDISISTEDLLTIWNMDIKKYEKYIKDIT